RAQALKPRRRAPPPGRAPSWATLDAAESREQVDELVDLLAALLLVVAPHRLGQAALEMAGEDHPRRLHERGLGGGDLPEDVDAVPVLVHHPLDAGDLPGDPLQAGPRCVPGLLIH